MSIFLTLGNGSLVWRSENGAMWTQAEGVSALALLYRTRGWRTTSIIAVTQSSWRWIVFAHTMWLMAAWGLKVVHNVLVTVQLVDPLEGTFKNVPDQMFVWRLYKGGTICQYEDSSQRPGLQFPRNIVIYRVWRTKCGGYSVVHGSASHASFLIPPLFNKCGQKQQVPCSVIWRIAQTNWFSWASASNPSSARTPNGRNLSTWPCLRRAASRTPLLH